MGARRMKFAVGMAVILGAALWLGYSGAEESKTYYKTCDEYVKLAPAAQARRTRLMGSVADGSIHREGGSMTFALSLNGATVPVVYRGSDPVPDTFKDGASAMVDGHLGSDGRFEGKTIQAKCASKYDADPATAYTKKVAAGGGTAQPAGPR